VEVNPFGGSLWRSLASAVFAGARGKTMVDKLADELIDAANARADDEKERRRHRMAKRTRRSRITAGRRISEQRDLKR